MRLGEVMTEEEMKEMASLQLAIDAYMRTLDKGPFGDRPKQQPAKIGEATVKFRLPP